MDIVSGIVTDGMKCWIGDRWRVCLRVDTDICEYELLEELQCSIGLM